MKCPKCNQEFSEPVLELHIKRCKNKEEKKNNEPKSIEQMNKAELLAKAKELNINIEDTEKTTKAQIIEMIKDSEKEPKEPEQKESEPKGTDTPQE